MKSYSSEGLILIGEKFNLTFLNVKEFYFWSNINELLPRVSIKFYSKDFTSTELLYDGQIITILLAVNSSSTHIINDSIQFSLTGYETSSADREGVKEITLYARLSNKYFFDRVGAAYNTTFTQCISNIMQQDVIIEKDSSDKMYWRKYNESTISFINKNINRSWITNNDSPVMYFDIRYKKYVYTSFKTASTREVIPAVYSKNGAHISLIGPNVDNQSVYFGEYTLKDSRSISTSTTDGYSINYVSDTGENKKVELLRKPILGKNTGKDNKFNIENISLNINYNPDMHPNYYIAPYNKQMIENAFLCNQLTIYTKPIETMRILDVLEVNIPDNLLASGKYFITAITYYIVDTNMYQILTLSRDYAQEFNGMKAQVK